MVALAMAECVRDVQEQDVLRDEGDMLQKTTSAPAAVADGAYKFSLEQAFFLCGSAENLKQNAKRLI
ncbi:hypothetical protein [Streptomyces sp. NPDC002952]|uniref:hypothetical protein n=1 Tax=Streptomyces sp. NPDC002952 TaxID=3364673 RepID=UPI003682CD4D